jgi:hypothetical protein
MKSISILIVCSHIVQRVNSFQTPFFHRISLYSSTSVQHATLSQRAPVPRLYAYDKIPEFNNDEDDDDDDDVKLSSKPLGLNIGSMMDPLTPQQAAELRAEAQQEINKAFQGRLEDILQLKQQLQQDFENSQKASQEASQQRAQEETQRLLEKIDAMSQNFLKDNQQERNELKLAARADQQMEGKGVELGSWGQIRGMDVVMKLSDTAQGTLLGSVGAATQSSSLPFHRRILILCDDKQVELFLDNHILNYHTIILFQNMSNLRCRFLLGSVYTQDKGIKKVLEKFTSLAITAFDQGFDNTVLIDKYTPTSTIPLGGNNAQCVILASTVVNGRSSAENILGRILKRTVSPGGAVGIPPSHIVVLSLLGTERTGVFPYSMQNVMSNKLSMCLEVEETVKGIIQGRFGDQVPMDYTIMKVGEVVEDSKSKSKFMLKSGDSLDGDVGVDAAAYALLQAVAYQPSARNATFSIVGGIDSSMSVQNSAWDDWFLRLDGPEILRIDDILPTSTPTDIVTEKYLKLSEFIYQWSLMFDKGAKGTGLTTPVSVQKSTLLARISEGVSQRSGVVLEFKPTMTGSAYKSKGEERESERQSPSGSGNTGSSSTNMSYKAKKEGGVEILVEMTTKGLLRLRVRRCNMDDSTVVKELSEETIIGKLKEALRTFIKENR